LGYTPDILGTQLVRKELVQQLAGLESVGGIQEEQNQAVLMEGCLQQMQHRELELGIRVVVEHAVGGQVMMREGELRE
jgi:hypothetical protein